MIDLADAGGLPGVVTPPTFDLWNRSDILQDRAVTILVDEVRGFG